MFDPTATASTAILDAQSCLANKLAELLPNLSVEQILAMLKNINMSALTEKLSTSMADKLTKVPELEAKAKQMGKEENIRQDQEAEEHALRH